MGKATKSILVIVMITSLTTMGLASNQAFAGFIVPSGNKDNPFLGDFKCYNVPHVDFLANDVLLEDQFVELQYDVEDIIKICTMVFKEGNEGPDGWDPSPEPLFFSAPQFGTDVQHFVVYELCDVTSNGAGCVPAPPVDVPVSIMDQFGTTDHVTPHIPVELWVPASKDHLECPQGYTFDTSDGMCKGPPSPCPPIDPGFPNQALLAQYSVYVPTTCDGPPAVVDSFSQQQNIHWKCYDIEPQVIGTKALILFDENFFPTGDDVEIDTADKLCNPVIKNEEPQQSLEIEHLKCYDFTVFDTLQADLAFSDQFHFFDPLFLQPVDGEEFCSAADKFPIRFIGGTIIPVDTVSLAIAAIGIDPLITGLVALTIAGVAGQTAWFIHRRKKKVLNS